MLLCLLHLVALTSTILESKWCNSYKESTWFLLGALRTYWHMALLRIRRRTIAHTLIAVPKMPRAPSVFPKRCVRHQVINLASPERVIARWAASWDSRSAGLSCDTRKSGLPIIDFRQPQLTAKKGQETPDLICVSGNTAGRSVSRLVGQYCTSKRYTHTHVHTHTHTHTHIYFLL